MSLYCRVKAYREGSFELGTIRTVDTSHLITFGASPAVCVWRRRRTWKSSKSQRGTPRSARCFANRLNLKEESKDPETCWVAEHMQGTRPSRSPTDWIWRRKRAWIQKSWIPEPMKGKLGQSNLVLRFAQCFVSGLNLKGEKNPEIFQVSEPMRGKLEQWHLAPRYLPLPQFLHPLLLPI